MKNIFKQTKVIYDAHLKEYQVWYRNFFVWQFDSCYKFDENLSHPIHYRNKQRAEEMSIERAQAMLNTVEVWRGSNHVPYV